MHHYYYLKHVERKLVLKNPDILGSIPTTVRAHDHVIDKEHIMQSPRGRKGPVYMEAESAKLPIQMFSHLILNLRNEEHVGEA